MSLETPVNFIEKFGFYHAQVLNNERQRVMRFVNPDHHGYSIIAGGVVASPWKAGDVDVWVSVNPDHFGEELHYIQGYIDKVVNADPSLSRVWGAGTIDDAYLLRGFFVAATIFEEGHKPTQVILTDLPGGDSILQSFDLACHAIGVGLEDNTIYVHPQWKHPIQGPTTILDYNTPLRTLERYLKLTERYMWLTNVENLRGLLDYLQDAVILKSRPLPWSTNNLAINLPEELEARLRSRAA